MGLQGAPRTAVVAPVLGTDRVAFSHEETEAQGHHPAPLLPLPQWAFIRPRLRGPGSLHPVGPTLTLLITASPPEKVSHRGHLPPCIAPLLSSRARPASRTRPALPPPSVALWIVYNTETCYYFSIFKKLFSFPLPTSRFFFFPQSKSSRDWRTRLSFLIPRLPWDCPAHSPQLLSAV